MEEGDAAEFDKFVARNWGADVVRRTRLDRDDDVNLENNNNKRTGEERIVKRRGTPRSPILGTD